MSGRGHYYPYEEEDDLDIRIRSGRARSRSPAPVLYSPREPVYAHHTRPLFGETQSYSGRGYQHPSGAFLIPAHSGGLHRSRSQGRRTPSPVYHSPPQPVIINNRIYNERDDEDDYHHHHHLIPRPRSRASSFNAPRDPRDEYELEKTRKELAAFKLEKDQAEERKRIAKELELERLRKEKEEEEEQAKLKEERKKAIEKYKIEEAEKAAKAKVEKEAREKEYQARLEEDLRKGGLDQKQIAVIMKKEPPKADPGRPIYTRMSRRHLSIETLNRFRIDYEFDHDPDYVLIKRQVPEYEQDFLWTHTREIRDKRHTLLTIEGRERIHKHGRKEDIDFEFVRKKKHERKPSPSPLLTFLAGGKR